MDESGRNGLRYRKGVYFVVDQVNIGTYHDNDNLQGEIVGAMGNRKDQEKIQEEFLEPITEQVGASSQF